MRLPDSINALAERDFRVVWTGQAISMTGTWMQMVAQGPLVLKLWNNPFALGALTLANSVVVTHSTMVPTSNASSDTSLRMPLVSSTTLS